MTDMQSAVIQPEAMPMEDWNLGEEQISDVISGLHGTGWKAPVETVEVIHLKSSSEETAVMIPHQTASEMSNWLGAKLVNSMKPNEMIVVANAVSKLREPLGVNSFVWSHVQDPSDVRPIKEAIAQRSKYTAATSSISHLMGADANFRATINGMVEDQDRHSQLQSVNDFYRESSLSMIAFYSSLEAVANAFEVIFGVDDMSVEAALVLMASSNGLKESLPMVRGGFELSRPPREDELHTFFELRTAAVKASKAVYDICFVNPIDCSIGVLAGVIRSLSADKAGDFVFAVEALGGRMESKEQIWDASKAFAEFILADRAFRHAVVTAGYAETEIAALLSHLLVRRQVITSAAVFTIDWRDIDIFFRVKETLSGDEFAKIVEGLSSKDVSGRLYSICKDRSRRLTDIIDAVKQAAAAKLAFLKTAEVVQQAYPTIEVAEVQEVIGLEPALRDAERALSVYGVNSLQTMSDLEAHLNWMIAVFALPVPDEAVQAVIDSRGAILPPSLKPVVRA